MAAVLVITPEEICDLVRTAVREELANHRNPEQEVLTADRVAEMLDVHVRTVAKLVARDGLPARRLGREYRFNRAEVLAWLAERSTRPGAHLSRHAETLRHMRVA